MTIGSTGPPGAPQRLRRMAEDTDQGAAHYTPKCSQNARRWRWVATTHSQRQQFQLTDRNSQVQNPKEAATGSLKISLYS